MKRFGLMCLFMTAVTAVNASWYWPFGSDDDDENSRPRFSELIEQASLEIDEANDAIADDKLDEALDHFRKALAELDRVERENADRAPTAEFASLRNKRALVNSSMDAIILQQSRENAKAVQVTDTTELERKFAARRQGKAQAELDYVASKRGEPRRPSAAAQPKQPSPSPRAAAVAKPSPTPPSAAKHRYTAEEIDAMLKKDPSDVKALNLRATMQAAAKDWKGAERTLDRAIECNPTSYYAYYNMAFLLLNRGSGSKEAARRYYRTGRQVGGPVNEALEQVFK